jgi:hypothetical protein
VQSDVKYTLPNALRRHRFYICPNASSMASAIHRSSSRGSFPVVSCDSESYSDTVGTKTHRHNTENLVDGTDFSIGMLLCHFLLAD